MTTVVRKATSQVTLGYNATAKDIRPWLDNVPEHAKINVVHYNADQRDPGYTTLTAEWSA